MDDEPRQDDQTDPGDELVIALKPTQLGALVAVLAAVFLIWRAVRRSSG